MGPTDSNREPPPPLTAKQKWKAERARKKREGKDEKPRRVTARCWLAHEFPMTVDDLLPILDVMSHANKHLNKANRLIQYWRADHGGAFPVKVTVPIAMTVYVVMRFKDFARLPATDDGMSGLPTRPLRSPARVRAQVVGPGAERGGGGGSRQGQGEGGTGTRSTQREETVVKVKG